MKTITTFFKNNEKMTLDGKVVALEKDLPLTEGEKMLIDDVPYDIVSIEIVFEDDCLAVSIHVEDGN